MLQRQLQRVALVAAMGGFLFGYDTAAINGANQFITAHFSLSPTMEGMAAASAILGCIPGALVAGFVSDAYGRRPVLIVCAILFLLSGIGSALPTSVEQFIAVRFFGGVAIGIASMVCPVYIGECAPTERRGQLGTLFQFGIVLGIFVTLFVNYAVQGMGDRVWNETIGWRWMMASEVVPALILLVLVRGTPESPRWLARRGRDDEALAILSTWMPADTATEELAHDTAAQVSAGSLFDRRYRLPILIVVVLALIQQFSGINAIMYYSSRIFMSAGDGADTAFLVTVGIGAVNLVFTVISFYLIDRIGRRPLLVVGLAAQVATLSASAWVLANPGGLVPLALPVFGFIAAFAVALGPIPWLMSAELCPAAIRGRAMSLMSFAVWVGSFLVAQSFPAMHDSAAIGPVRTFAIFALASLFGLLFSLRFVPETRGKSLASIELELAAHRSLGKSASHLSIGS